MRDARVFVEVAKRSGSTWAAAVSASTIGRAHLAGEGWSQARESLEHALGQARQQKLGLEAEASFLAFLAEALTGCGKLGQALATAEKAFTVACRQETFFWELEAQVALVGVILRREQIKDHSRIAKVLERAEKLIEKTGGEVMKPFVIKRQAELATLVGDNPGHHRMLKEAYPPVHIHRGPRLRRAAGSNTQGL